MQLINFSINSAYKFLSNNDNGITNVSPLLDQVWHWQGLNRIRTILWKLAHGSLMTNAVRAHRQMTTDDTCPRCQTHPETIMHMLRDCEDAQNYWNQFITEDNWAKFFSLGLYAWLEWNISNNHIGASNTYWPTFFGVSVWSLWKDRNKLVFSRETKLGTNLTSKTVNIAYQIEKEMKFPLASRSENPCQKYMHCSKPPAGFFKVNTDGS
ncbi:hypothetical protein QL285_017240 [Trifolium repens]|nr:hypothetical protein QL285_017240 [Trifolium repens]